ncbi:MAG: hypothetical protein H6718_06015 [Polyangiaceae bacterium]|nr:hypothetical protein [Polyangiaceae bacterium]MCB9607495.1 hypothetical protein [Polyangiaceae bacterium]
MSIVAIGLIPSLTACGSDSESSGGSAGSAGSSGAAGNSGSGGSAGAGQGGAGATGGTSSAGSAGVGAGGAAGGSGSAGQGVGGSAGAPTGTPLFVGVGSWGYRVATSDGVQTDITQNPETGSDHSPDLLRDVAWGGGAFVAVGGDQNSMVMRSTDGKTWQEDLHPSGTQWKGGVAYGGGRWVAVGGVGTVIYSDDGGTVWQDSSERLPSAGRDIAYGGGQFVAVGDGGMIATSSDGTSWTDHTQTGVGLSGVAYLPAGAWVVTGRNWNGSGFDISCFGSADGSSWTPCGFNISLIGRPSAVDGALIVPTDSGYESTTDGTNWTHHDGDIPELVLQADSVLVGSSNDRLFSGSSLGSMSQTAMLDRSLRGFCLGYVQ